MTGAKMVPGIFLSEIPNYQAFSKLYKAGNIANSRLKQGRINKFSKRVSGGIEPTTFWCLL